MLPCLEFLGGKPLHLAQLSLLVVVVVLLTEALARAAREAAGVAHNGVRLTPLLVL